MRILKYTVISFLLCNSIYGQSFKNDVVQILRQDNDLLKEYAAPLSEAFGAILSSSAFYNAKSYNFPHFDIGLNYLSAPISSKRLTFSSNSRDIPTVFGKATQDSSFITGTDINSFKLPVLQLSIGIGDNTNFFIRYADWSYDKLGNVSVLGAGIKYELENLFSLSPIPFNIGILALYQKYEVDDFVEGAVFSMNIIASKKFNAIPTEFYGSIGYVNNVTNISDPENMQSESQSIAGLEEIRYGLGLSYNLFLFNFNAEYNFGSFNALSAGIRIVID